MIPIYKDTKVYVACPAYAKSGGPELLHQLVNKLKKIGVNAVIAYYDTMDNKPNYRDSSFDVYTTEFIKVEDIEDNKKNVLIIPESRLWMLNKYKNIRKCIWWLSVDIAFNSVGIINCLKKYHLLATINCMIKGRMSYSINIINKADYHLCQSKYSMEFLKAKGIKDYEYLSDYLNETFIKNSHNVVDKENNILYNPKKGFEFTNKIINSAPNLNWIPIINLSNDEVKDLLMRSKVYIDFGNHPGKDRIPREAVICNCCIITSKRGSAKYYEDVPISDDFKFDDIDENISKIIDKINLCLEHYEEQIKHFEEYKKIIMNSEKEFEEDIQKIFKLEV